MPRRCFKMPCYDNKLYTLNLVSLAQAHYQILLERLKSKYMTQVYRNESDRQHQKRKRARKRFISEHPFCNFCGAVDKLTIDHIIPKSKIKRRHNQSNWQVLCEKCNYKKKDKILLTSSQSN